MADVTQDQVTAALSKVSAPGKGADLIAAGMVSGVSITPDHVTFSIEVDPAEAHAMEDVRKQAEQAIKALAPGLKVTAVLTAERKPGPVSAQNQASAQNRASPRKTPPPGVKTGGQGRMELPHIQSIVAVASGKGGVGKSTTTANLATALAATGLKVGILDADIFGPSMPRMLGLSGRKPSSPDGKTIIPLEAHGVKVMSIGFMVGEEDPVVWRGPMVMGAVEQMLRDVDWGPLDVLVVDMPPGTGDAQLTLSQRAPLTGAVIVSTPQDIALLDARKGLNMFRKVDVPVLGIIENMSYYECPSCGHRDHVFSHGGAKETAVTMKAPFLGGIPLDIRIREFSDSGQPITVADPTSAHAEAYLAIAAKVWDGVTALRSNASPTRFVVE